MDNQTLRTLVHNLQRVNVIPDINSGGCAVFASLLGEELLKLGYDVKVVSIGFTGSHDPDAKYNNIKETNPRCTPDLLHNNGIDLCHLLVELQTSNGPVYIDSNGINHLMPDGAIPFMNGAYIFYIDGRMPVSGCTEIAKVARGWNPIYDRSNNNKMKLEILQAVSSIRQIKEEQYA